MGLKLTVTGEHKTTLLAFGCHKGVYRHETTPIVRQQNNLLKKCLGIEKVLKQGRSNRALH